jgi:uncharacterized protein involved in exopolysaccharide biosynthesis
MLQKLNFEDGPEDDRDFLSTGYPEVDQSHLLKPSFYWQLIKRRAFYFVIPFILVLSAGLAVAALWPATYLSEGKIIVQSQQIPTELVRPTVTSGAQERIQAIEQRTMTRDNLMAIVEKFRLFPGKRTLMTTSQLVELMKKSTKIAPLDEPLAFQGRRTDNPTIVFSVGFESTDPQTAAAVANELVTRILNEDLRDRTSRATDTTKFLAREVEKLQAANAAIDAKIAQAKLSEGKVSSSNSPDTPASQLAQLKVELIQKSALYSDKHPVMQALKRQIEALEKVVAAPLQAGPNAQVPLEVLETQQDDIQKNLEVASAKLTAAHLGETLEKDQQSEKLEVIEQPSTPQDPVRPNRPKIAAIALFLALAAGGGLAFLAETADKSIRRSNELFRVVDSRLVVAVPYITTQAELRRQKKRRLVLIAGAIALCIGIFVVVFVFLPPLDLMIAKARVGLFK